MPEEPWLTYIMLSSNNPALKKEWDNVADQLRMILARLAWDTRAHTLKLKEISNALGQIKFFTPDMTKPPRKRFK